jgi:nucleoside-diphosphate-sugar epimerase
MQPLKVLTHVVALPVLVTDMDTLRNIGAAGVIYPSMPVIFDAEPAKVFDPMTKGVINTLEAAARAGVQRYVLSSSSKAVSSTSYGPLELTSETFNYDAIEQARIPSTDTSFHRKLTVYCAGRALAELAFWDWIKENKPPFVANCLVPDGQFGRVLDMENTNTGLTSSIGQLECALQGEWQGVAVPLGK